MRHRLPIACLIAAGLLTAGCQNPDGSTNWGGTLALGAGAAALAGLAVVAAQNNRPQHRPYGYQYGHGRPYAHGAYRGRRW
jgi:hypothetical protein